MTGWIIAGAVIAVILILLMTSVKVSFGYSDELSLKISWLFLTFVRIPAVNKRKRRRKKDKPKKANKADKTEKADEPEKTAGQDSEAAEISSPEKKTGEKPEKKPDKKKRTKLGLNDIFELVKLVWESLSKPLQRLLKATRINGFRLDIVCGGDDAAKAALNYGRTNIAAGAAIAFLEGCFTIKKPVYNISCNFLEEETRMECSFTARLSVIAALAFLFWVLGRAVKRYLIRKETAAAVGKLRK